MKAKAWTTYVGRCSGELYGCCLVFAKKRAGAKALGMEVVQGFGLDVGFTDMRARRAKEFDRFLDTSRGQPYAVETNADLPDDAPEFYDDEI